MIRETNSVIVANKNKIDNYNSKFGEKYDFEFLILPIKQNIIEMIAAAINGKGTILPDLIF